MNIAENIARLRKARGLTQEALAEVFLHAQLPIEAFSWFCATDNAPSLHLAEKFGFTYVKTFSKDDFNLPTPCDHVYLIRKRS